MPQIQDHATISVKLSIADWAIYQRGLFIHRYAGVEYSLSTLIVFASAHPSYKFLGSLPYSVKGKLERFKEILDMPGPLTVYAEDLLAMQVKLTDFEGQRAFIAHGLLTTNEDGSNPIVRFNLFRHIDGKANAPVMEMTMVEFEELNALLLPLSTGFPRLIVEIIGKLEPESEWPIILG